MEEKKKILYVDMDGVLVDFDSGLKQAEPDLLKIYKGQLDNIPNLFSWMVPMPGAIEAFKALAEKYDTYILTTAPWKNETALQDKKDWLNKYFCELIKKKVIFSHHKELLIGDYLIDDRPVNGFKGKQFLFGSKEYPDWNAITKELL
jgi:5'(3')-deoxyribonucleotidase